jgi:hypothetical protein
MKFFIKIHTLHNKENVMEFTERDNRLGDVGYASMVWVRDDEGREFSCTLIAPVAMSAAWVISVNMSASAA